MDGGLSVSRALTVAARYCVQRLTLSVPHRAVLQRLTLLVPHRAVLCAEINPFGFTPVNLYRLVSFLVKMVSLRLLENGGGDSSVVRAPDS